MRLRFLLFRFDFLLLIYLLGIYYLRRILLWIVNTVGLVEKRQSQSTKRGISVNCVRYVEDFFIHFCVFALVVHKQLTRLNGENFNSSCFNYTAR